MIQELWGVFPRLLEQNINGLLDRAEPNSARAFQLYKACKSELLWSDTYQKFTERLEEYYAQPRAQRRKSDFDKFLDRPMDVAVYENFQLDFRTAVVNEKAVADIASWAHHLIRVSRKTTSVVISIDVMLQTLKKITNPAPFEKADTIDFDDFCSAWEKTVAKRYGMQHDPEFNEILADLQWINANLKESERIAKEGKTAPVVYLTQMEIDWTSSVRKAAFERGPVPKFPLGRGPQKLCLMELDRVISLYRVVQTTSQPELLKQRENVRVTLLDRCDRLLGKKIAVGH